MHQRLVVLACVTAVLSAATARAESSSSEVLLDNERVLILRGPSVATVSGHTGIVVPLQDGADRKAGEAYWSGDASARPATGPVVLIEPRTPRDAAPPSPSPAATKAPPPAFVGVSFKPIFENDRVVAVRGTMDVGAHEGFHTHTFDMVVVHLSGGTIEDTALGKTTSHTWHRGDVEFEAFGTSHSSRNTGAAVDVVLVRLKPRA